MTVYQDLTIRIESYQDSARLADCGKMLRDMADGMKIARDNMSIEAASCEVL